MSIFLIFWTAYLPIVVLAIWSLGEWLAAVWMKPAGRTSQTQRREASGRAAGCYVTRAMKSPLRRDREVRQVRTHTEPFRYAA